MTKLVFVTQTLDPEHPALAQTLDLVQALSVRFDELAVVTREDRWDARPPNVHTWTFDASSRLGRVGAFELALSRALPRAEAVLVHMVPEFLLLAVPQAKARRIPLLLWYTHWNAGRLLRLALPITDAVLSVDTTSFPLQTPKLRAVGHAIDTRTFDAAPLDDHDPPIRFLSVGRTARWKGLETLLDAFAIVVDQGVDATLDIRGPSLTDDEAVHRSELEQRIAGDERLRSRAHLYPAVARAEIPALLGSADVVVSPNEPRSGATLDKAVFEAAACARPVVSTNSAFAPLLGGLPLPLLAPPRDVLGLASLLAEVAGATASARAETGAALRARVLEEHSVEHWADAVAANISEVRSRRGQTG